MYAFSNGERALRRAASYVELRWGREGGRERVNEREKRERERGRRVSHQKDGFMLCPQDLHQRLKM